LGSIAIARSISPDDSVDLTRLSYLNSTRKELVLDGSLKGEVKKKHNSNGWTFSCFAAQLFEQDLF